MIDFFSYEKVSQIIEAQKDAVEMTEIVDAHKKGDSACLIK